MDMAAHDKRLLWVDTARGLCMLAILLFHTERYYEGVESIPYVVYAGNAAIAFFFVSGYLFIRPGTVFSVRKKLRSILRNLVIPYFIFTTVIAFPKAFVHSQLTLTDTLTSIVTGHATWFVPALIVTQLLFILALKLSKGNLRLLACICAIPFVVVALLYHTIDNETLEKYNIWCWQNAFFMLFFFFMGHSLRRNAILNFKNSKVFKNIKKSKIFVFAALLLITIEMKWLEWQYGIMLTVEPIHISSFTLLLIDGIIYSLLVCSISRLLPRITPVEWTGAYSLYYYFICGGVPLLVTMIFTKCGLPYNGHFWRVIPAFIMVYIVSTAIVWVLTIYKRKQ